MEESVTMLASLLIKMEKLDKIHFKIASAESIEKNSIKAW
jgi:hypothetical protein